ncbi:MAG: YidC/Oxa1 family membrane protein insertase [Patescibacteria group bacterium]|nr:YidC/Oxa1 family membrane protein insertase [Patescibacteria group bacterium]
MIQLFNLILYQPLLNLLVFFYNTIAFRDLGLAIIFLTIFLKIILYPTSLAQIKNQKLLIELQPKLNEIKKKFSHDRTKMAQATIELYRHHKINPFSSCLSLMVQLPILIAVYQVFRTGILSQELNLYPFIHNPGQLNPIAFGFINFAEKNFPLALLTGMVQFWQSKMLSRKKPPPEVKKEKEAKDESMMAMMNRQMMVMMPLFTVIIGMTLPSGLIFYWLINLILTIGQQFFFFKKQKILI